MSAIWSIVSPKIQMIICYIGSIWPLVATKCSARLVARPNQTNMTDWSTLTDGFVFTNTLFRRQSLSVVINHIMYAYDIVLIYPSSAGFNVLLNFFNQFGIQNDIEYNSKKIAILPFLPEDKKKIRIPTFELNNEIVPIVDSFKFLGHWWSWYAKAA